MQYKYILLQYFPYRLFQSFPWLCRADFKCNEVYAPGNNQQPLTDESWRKYNSGFSPHQWKQC